jgi:dTDP-4-amino-4,6-dideoxygalactose transaminase
MTAFQAALLIAGMERLEEQTARRHTNGQYLDAQLSQIEGLQTLTPDPRIERNAYHLYIFKYRTEEWGGVSRDAFLRALRAEGIPASPGYTPLYRQEAFVVDIQTMPQFQGREIPYGKLHLPVCERAAQESVWIFQSVLLGTREDMDDIVEAIAKLRRNVDELRRAEEEAGSE